MYHCFVCVCVNLTTCILKTVTLFQYAGYGALILLIGFMAFNGGSVMSVSNPGDGPAMSLSIVNTMISAGCGGYSSLIIRR